MNATSLIISLVATAVAVRAFLRTVFQGLPTIRSLLLTLTLLILPLSPATGQDWQAVSEASERGDYATVIELLRPFAEQGHAPAQTALGLMYYEAVSVQDYAEAARWFRKAAEQGHAGAQYNLGVMYAQGEGVPQDYVFAYAWLNVAAVGGDEKTKKAKDTVQNLMTAKQIARGQEMSTNLFNRINPAPTE